MARYTPLSAAHRAAAMRDIEMTLAAGSARSNPAGKTIKARRTSTCPISDEKIEVGDSITKTESGWALTKYVRAAKSNPSAGGRAMKYARAHGVPLKQGWAAVKAGKANPRGRPLARKVDYAKLRNAELRALAGSGDNRAAEQLEDNEMRYQTWHARQPESRENPSMGGRAMQYSRAHGVSLKEGWKAVKSGLSNPYHENPSKEAEVQALARQVLKFWPKVSPTAEQQLFFMLNPEYIQGGDTINMVVASFLGNALGWRGEDARRIKAQLNALLR